MQINAEILKYTKVKEFDEKVLNKLLEIAK